MKKSTIITVIVALLAVITLSLLGKQESTPLAVDEDQVEETSVVMENVDYVGLSVDDAIVKAEEQEVMFRVVIEDGQPQPTTKDFQPGRINATVEDGIVTQYTVEGEEIDSAEDPDNITKGAAAHDSIIGMTTNEAEAYAKKNEVPFRIGFIDGESMPVTMDFSPGRITAEITDGLITGYTLE